jgi:hypothetical protein
MAFRAHIGRGPLLRGYTSGWWRLADGAICLGLRPKSVRASILESGALISRLRHSRAPSDRLVSVYEDSRQPLCGDVWFQHVFGQFVM